MNDTVLDILQAMTPLCMVVAAALLTYRLGLRAYFQQKEYESVRKRYLEDTLDLFASHVEHCLSVHRSNWQASLIILKAFRDAGTKMTADGLSARICHVDHANLHFAAAYRLGDLLNGNTSFFSMQQLLIAFSERGSSFLEDDLLHAIRLASAGVITEEQLPQVFTKYMDRITALNAESRPFYILLTEVSTIAHLFESERPTYATMRTFFRNKEVRGAVDRVEKALRTAVQEGALPVDDKVTTSTN